MGHSADGLFRFGLKLFLAPGSNLDGPECVPIFHRWIQEAALDRLLIDVADYTHLVDGPRVLLVGHEGNLSVDTAEGRTGLLCTWKRPEGGSFAHRLADVARTLLGAGHLLESEPDFKGELRFSGQELQFVSNDRLVAPPGTDSVALLTPALRGLLESLYPGQRHEISDASDSNNRLTMRLAARESTPLATLLRRASQTVTNE